MSTLEEIKQSLVPDEDDPPLNSYISDPKNYEDLTEDKINEGREPKQSFISKLSFHKMIAQKELALIHRKASQAGKNSTKSANFEKCQCCGNFIDKPLFNLCMSYKNYKELGIAYALYFEYIALMLIFLLLFFFIVCLPCSIDYTDKIGLFDRNEYISETIDSHSKISHFQIILQCVGLTMILVFYPILQFVLQKRIFKYSENTLTESSFTVFVRNLPQDFNSLELREHFDKFLPSDPDNYKTLIVVKCFELFDAIKYSRRINEINSKIAFLKAYKDENNKSFKSGFICKKEISIQGLENELKTIEKMKKDSVTECKKIGCMKSLFSCCCKHKEDLEVQERVEKKPEYSAFVVFRKMSYALMIKKNLNFSVIQYLKTNILPSFMQNDTVYRFKGNYIYTEMTPELSDVIWENIGLAKFKLILLEIIIACSVFLIIYFLIGIVYIRLAAFSLLNQELYKNIIFSSIIPIIASIMNFITKKIFVNISIQEKHYSYTNLYLSLYKKFVGFTVTVVIGLQLIFFILFLSSRVTVNYVGYVLSSLVVNGIVNPLLSFFIPIFFNYAKLLYYSKIIKRLDMTQKEANEKLELTEIMLYENMANLMLILFIGITYSPIVPEGIAIVIVSCLLQVFLFHIKLAKFTKIPKKLDGTLILLASENFPWVIFLYSLSIGLFYVQKNPDEFIIVQIFLCISWAYLLLLALGFFRCFKMSGLSDKRIKSSVIDNKMFFDYYEKFPSDYELKNPATSLNGQKRLEAYKKNPSEKNFIESEYKYNLLDNLEYSFANHFI